MERYDTVRSDSIRTYSPSFNIVSLSLKILPINLT